VRLFEVLQDAINSHRIAGSWANEGSDLLGAERPGLFDQQSENFSPLPGMAQLGAGEEDPHLVVDVLLDLRTPLVSSHRVSWLSAGILSWAVRLHELMIFSKRQMLLYCIYEKCQPCEFALAMEVLCDKATNDDERSTMEHGPVTSAEGVLSSGKPTLLNRILSEY
jgi:hypothetical protein